MYNTYCFCFAFFFIVLCYEQNYINRINHNRRTYSRGTRRKNIAAKYLYKIATWTRCIIRRRYRHLSSVFTWRGFDGPTSFRNSFMMREMVTFTRGKRFEPFLLPSINFNFFLLSTFFQMDDFYIFFNIVFDLYDFQETGIVRRTQRNEAVEIDFLQGQCRRVRLFRKLGSISKCLK